MITRYLEAFDLPHQKIEVLASHLARHLYARQHLGKMVVICEDPKLMHAQIQKQWRKLSRSLQQRRSFSSNAVEILKYTYHITQMQQTTFSTKSAADQPSAQVYFMAPAVIGSHFPVGSMSIYLTCELSAQELRTLTSRLPESSLMIDYTKRIDAEACQFIARSNLEKEVRLSWKGVNSMLSAQLIDIARLTGPQVSSDAIDDAVDALLGVHAEFLALAKRFQYQLDLAQPLRSTPKPIRDRYDAFVMLAYRVQMYSGSEFSPRFLQSYADDTFFLNDRLRGRESWDEMILRHQMAGRLNIVRRLERLSIERRSPGIYNPLPALMQAG